VDGARLGYERAYPAQNWVTILLIVLSVGLAFFSKFGENRKVLAPYMISNYYRDASGVSYHLPTVREHGGVLSEGGVFTGLGVLPEVFRGEAWRLVTPIFIHFGLLHLLFNLTMLWNLGGAIEGRFGAMYFGILVGVLALGSNLAQVFWSSPNFGGMSGVDYGLFGFLWIRGNRDRYATWQVPSGTVRVMLIWFFVCAIGVIPDVANGAHAGGLLIGMIWGWISARR
jgi:membrane associated rhomboid family serine protease